MKDKQLWLKNNNVYPTQIATRAGVSAYTVRAWMKDDIKISKRMDELITETALEIIGEIIENRKILLAK
jgi:hypothetical protein